MVRESEIRENEVAVPFPERVDAGLLFIGRIRTPWTSRLECPRQGRLDGPICRIEIFEPWVAALDGIERFERLEVL
jgi:tRNA (Thr-GGU) A37 N-methylase